MEKDGKGENENAEHGHDPPKFVRGAIHSEEAVRAERDLRCAEKTGEVGEAGIFTLSDECLEDFRVWPVAHVKYGARKQRSQGSGEADPKSQWAGSKSG